MIVVLYCFESFFFCFLEGKRPTCLVMVCSSLVRRSVIVQAGYIGVLARGRRVNKTLSGFRISAAAKMSVESSRVSLVDMPPHKVDDGGYVGGGWKK